MTLADRAFSTSTQAETAEQRQFLLRPPPWIENPALFGIRPISEAGLWRILQELHHSLSLEPSSRSDEMIPAYHPAKQSKPRINARMEMHDGSKRLTKKVWLGKSHGEPPCRASKATRQGNLGMIAAQYAIDSLSSRSGALIGFPRVSTQRSNPQKCQQGWMKFRSHSKQCDIQTKRLRFTPLCARTVLSC